MTTTVGSDAAVDDGAVLSVRFACCCCVPQLPLSLPVGMARTRSQSGAGSGSGVGASDGERDPSVSPLLDGSKSGATVGLDEQNIIAHAPCNHSWRYSPVKYTAASIAIWIVFFYRQDTRAHRGSTRFERASKLEC